MRNLLTLLVLATALLGLAGCFPKKTAGKASPADTVSEDPKAATIPVQATRPTRADISSYFETNSRVEAEARVEVMAEGTGRCVSVRVEEGDTVDAGDVLAELDKKQAQASLHQAEVQLRKNKADYDRVKKGREEDGASLYSDQDADAARFTYEQGLANVELQRIQVENLTIRAPISGLVTRKDIQPGQFISAGSSVFSIVDPNTFMLVIDVQDLDLPRLREGQAALVRIDALDGQEFEAHIRRINPGIDPVSLTFRVTLDFDAETRERLIDGAYAWVRLVTDTHHNAILLPKNAVVDKNVRKYVFVLREPTKEQEPDVQEAQAPPPDEGGKSESGDGAQAKKDMAAPEELRFVAEQVEVKVGLEDSQFVEILDGIEADALVVTMGQHTLKHGTEVTLTSVEDALSEKGDVPIEEALAEATRKREESAQKAKSESKP